MSHSSRRGALAARIVEQTLWGDSPFFLIDVGCSGGIDALWSRFGDHLRAVGFDPLVAEVDRLNAAAPPGVAYEAAFVGCRDYDHLFPPALRHDRVASKNGDPFARVSAIAVQRRTAMSFEQEHFNAGAPIVLAERTVVLDEWLDRREYSGVDFVKIDTDGHDIEVLLGAEGILSAGGALGLKIECAFHGAVHPHANTLANIDRFMREHGFTLFDLTSYKYSRAELPAPFVYDLAAQTVSGQAMWGDGVYFRDLASPDYERMWPGYTITPERVLKLACLFDLFDLPDCAAELLLSRGQFLDAARRGELLDLLAPAEYGSYAAHVAAFDADYKSFYPSRRRAVREEAPIVPGAERGTEPAPAADTQPVAAAPADIEAGPVADETASAPATIDPPAPAKTKRVSVKRMRRLRERVNELRAKNDELRGRLKERGDRIEQLTRRIGELEKKR